MKKKLFKYIKQSLKSKVHMTENGRSSAIFLQLIGYVAKATRPLSYRKIAQRSTALDFNKYY